MPKKPNGNLKPWSEVWQEILNLRALDTAGVDLTPDPDGWLSIKCPAHGDRNPSLRLNLNTGGVKCMSRLCFGEGGHYGTNLNDLMDYVLDKAARKKGKRPDDVIGDLAERRMLRPKLLIEVFDVRPAPGGYSLAGCDPWIDPAVADDEEQYHTDHRYFKRGVWVDEHATTLPKYQWKPSLRRTSFGAKDLVYNICNIEGKKRVYIVGGPPDVWVMHQNKMPAVSFLAGENSPPSTRAIDRLVNRGVEEAIVIYDNDAAGKEGAEKVAQLLIKHGVAATILTLPEEVGHKGDITDLWIRCEGDTAKFEKALASCESRSYATDVRRRVDERHAPEPLPTLPPEVWVEPFDSYRKALVKTTSSPEEYHFFALLNVIGALLGRRINVDYARKLYPNQYTCLVGPTGEAFKSTAMEKALDIARAVDSRLHMSSGGGSAEGLLEAMAFADADPEEYPVIRSAMGQTKQKKDDDGKIIDEERLYEKLHRRLLIVQDEFTVLLSKAKGGGRGGGTMIPHLLNAFNCPPEIKLPTRNKPLIVAKPTVNILSASTVEFLGNHFDEEDWYSGFGNRLVFVEADTNPPVALPLPPDEERWAYVIEHVKSVYERFDEAEDAQRPVTFRMTDKAAVLWEELYNQWYTGRKGMSADQVAATQRTPEYALKFALIFAACAMDGGETKIAPDDIDLGFKVARFAEQVNHRLVDTLMSDVNAQKEQQIIEYIRQRGPKSRRELQTRFSKWGTPRFNLLMDNLEGAEIIYKDEDGRWALYT